jgi:uncharacterized metal-binding protein YceD (DUF177 family)
MTPELSRPVRVETIGPAGLVVEVVADGRERAAVARRLGVASVAALECRFRLEPAGSRSFAASARLRARLERECVVTLEPFEAVHDERFRLRFVPAGTEAAQEDPESVDEIPYEDGVIDLGEAAVEQLALGLDPYPRRPGAVLEVPGEAEAEGPFAALAGMRRGPAAEGQGEE